jgi:hypothetical protein
MWLTHAFNPVTLNLSVGILATVALSVDERGGLCLRSGAQRFYERAIGFRFPLLFSGVAEVCEWYDDADQRFHIKVYVSNSTWGPLFGYQGSFQVEWRPVREQEIPADILPARCERREWTQPYGGGRNFPKME